MAFRGMMDGWHGDEHLVDEFEPEEYDNSDELYDAWRDEQE